MMDYLIQTVLSNVVLAMSLAVLAMLVGWKAKHTGLAHMLWILVLLKLITPPILNIPVANFDSPSAATAGIDLKVDRLNDGDDWGSTMLPALSASPQVAAWNWHIVKHALVFIWLLGTTIAICISLLRVFRFNRLLNLNSVSASEEVMRESRALANCLGLAKLPQIKIVTASISPMVWWAGGRVRIVLPDRMLEQMEQTKWRWVLAHELGHVKRRDHWVRWLEWISCCVFWWNPIAWWAQRNLRATEEICCDSLVLSTLMPEPVQYANSILDAVESLVCPAIRPPAMASEISGGGFLERRFEMIMSSKTNTSVSRWSWMLTLAAAFLVIPLGIAQGQDLEKVEKRLSKMVKKGEINLEQANAMMEALIDSMEDDEHAHEDHAHEDHEHGDHEHGDHEHGDHEHDDHEQGEGEEDWDELWDDVDWDNPEDAMRVIGTRIRQAVSEGDMDPKKGRAIMQELRAKFADDHDDEKDEEEELGIDEFERMIRGAIRAGKLTKEQGREKLKDMYRKMKEADLREGDEERDVDEEEREMKARYLQVANEIKDALEAGELSEEEAEERLVQMRKRMFGARNDVGDEQSMKAKKARYMEAAKEIEKAVEAGEVSKEDAEERLIRMRERMFRSGDAQRQRKMNTLKARYIRAVEQMKEAIERGRISEEEAEDRLIELRNRMFGDHDEEQDHDDEHEHEHDDDEGDHGHDDQNRDDDDHDRDDHDHDDEGDHEDDDN